MKKIIITGVLFFLIVPVFSNNDISKLSLDINWKTIDWITIFNSIDKKIDSKSRNNLETKKEIYITLIKNIDSLETKIWAKNTITLKDILIYWYRQNVEDIEVFYSQTQKITLWYTKNWKEIVAYYKWNPEDWFFGIFANIHGWYEYGTYESALYLLDELNNSWKTGRFIIPTLNPDWLEIYKELDDEKMYYIYWRTNSNNVDINRNFCTENFELKSFLKNWIYLETGIWSCNSENETQIIIDTLKDYKFNQVISLHSEWHIFFIPENSFDDIQIRNFWSQIHELLPEFEFDLSYSSDEERYAKIYQYEIDEWWSRLYTWTMETYIYENYNIPVLLIELENHGEIDYDLKNVINYLK